MYRHHMCVCASFTVAVAGAYMRACVRVHMFVCACWHLCCHICQWHCSFFSLTGELQAFRRVWTCSFQPLSLITPSDSLLLILSLKPPIPVSQPAHLNLQLLSQLHMMPRICFFDRFLWPLPSNIPASHSLCWSWRQSACLQRTLMPYSHVTRVTQSLSFMLISASHAHFSLSQPALKFVLFWQVLPATFMGRATETS